MFYNKRSRDKKFNKFNHETILFDFWSQKLFKVLGQNLEILDHVRLRPIKIKSNKQI